MTMLGIPLSTYKEELHHIPKGILPTRTIERFEERLLPFAEEIEWRARQYEHFDPAVQCHALPDEFYETCTFEELAKLWATHFIQFPHQVEKLFEESVTHHIAFKLRDSLFRWGYGDAAKEWNSLADTYNGIKNFSFELPEFEVRLAYTYWQWSRGETPHAPNLFLDGVFGFLIHYRGEHVMTIGFSLACDNKLLLSQVQLRTPKGNRFLYRLPQGHLAYAITLMRKYFPRQMLCLVDGASLVDRYISGCMSNIAEVKNMRVPDLTCLKKNEDKLVLLQGELGEYLRGVYRPVASEKWRVSTYHPVTFNNIRFNRIVRA